MAEVLDHVNLERRGWRVNRRAIYPFAPHESLKKYGDAVRVGEVVMRLVSPCAAACCCIEFWTR